MTAARSRALMTVLVLAFFAIAPLLACDGADEDETDPAAPDAADDDDGASNDDDTAGDVDNPADDDHADDDAADDDADDDELLPYSDPGAFGPFAVGVTTIFVTDPSRYETWGKMDRTLPIEVWYPSNGGGGRVNTMPDMVGGMPGWGMAVLHAVYQENFDILWAVTTAARRDAEWAESPSRFPVILFSHGLTAIRFQNYHLCEYLASHGFVVVAPDHYGNAIFTNVPGPDVVLVNPSDIAGSLIDRPIDVRLIYDALRNGEVPSPIAGRVDVTRFGISGHSYGGTTAFLSGMAHEFIDAAAPLNPGWINLMLDFEKPLFVLQSELDSVVGFAHDFIVNLYDNASTPQKAYLELANAEHYTATDACLLVPEWLSLYDAGCADDLLPKDEANAIVSRRLTAFFQVTLNGDNRYLASLADPDEPEAVTYEVEWDETR
ncbi:hypothetical protein K8I61_00650 [bacterium]|nr:hypothetical protein [bacterium]